MLGVVCPVGHAETADDELQEGQQIIGDSHPHVVILFSDIVGFSTLASELSAPEVFILVRGCQRCAWQLHGICVVPAVYVNASKASYTNSSRLTDM